jgi:DNA recombination protein RmuC
MFTIPEPIRCIFVAENQQYQSKPKPLMNTFIYIILALVAVCTICTVIVMVKVFSRQETTSDVSSKDFDRLEGKISEENRSARQELSDNIDKIRKELSENVGNMRMEFTGTVDRLRSIVEEKLTTMSEKFQEGFEKNTEKMVEAQKERFAEMDKRQSDLIQTTEKRLDEMRVTVDEKLQKTLNDRLGQSFKLVSEQLESVQKGLGEMKNLASDVGGLKNALTNVKVRGNFGELQLKALLEQMLSPEQYDENVATVPGSSERVEFAIKLPGKDDPHGSVYLPVDSKFPKDVYDQYVDAIDTGDASAIKSKSSQFENTILAMAKDISNKYISVPDTTNFAIMFVPVENIYAEVIRRSKLTQELRDKWNVLVTGPTTLGALLSSLQMGFRTLAIEKRSNDVWTTLGAVKTEFSKFGNLLEKAKKNIDSASATIEQLQGTRTKAIKRKLREVEALPTDQAAALLPDMGEEGILDEE